MKDFLIRIGKLGTDALIITDGPDWMRQFLHPLAFKYRIKLNQFFHRFTGLSLFRCNCDSKLSVRPRPPNPDFRFEKSFSKLCPKYTHSFRSRRHNGTPSNHSRIRISNNAVHFTGQSSPNRPSHPDNMNSSLNPEKGHGQNRTKTRG